MRSRILIICLLLLPCTSATQSGPAGARFNDDSAALLEFDKAWCDAYKNSDVSWFERNFAEDAVIVLGSGATISKGEELEALRKGHGPIESFTSSDSVFHIDGNLAVESSIAHLSVRDSSGQLVSSDYRASTAYVRRDGRWQALLDHATLIQ